MSGDYSKIICCIHAILRMAYFSNNHGIKEIHSSYICSYLENTIITILIILNFY